MAALARKAGVSQGYVSMLESRKTQTPSAVRLEVLTRVLPLPLEYFLRDDAAIPGESLDVLGNAIAFLTVPDSAPYLAAAIATWDKGMLVGFFQALTDAPRGTRGGKKGESAKREQLR